MMMDCTRYKALHLRKLQMYSDYSGDQFILIRAKIGCLPDDYGSNSDWMMLLEWIDVKWKIVVFSI